MEESVLLAILFADRVIEEKNGKKGIIGTFTSFNSNTFPAIFAPWFIYIAVTNLKGKHNFSVILSNDELKQVPVSIGGEFESKTPNTVIELVFPIEKAVFPQEGTYLLTFYIDGAEKGQRFLEVNLQTESSRR